MQTKSPILIASRLIGIAAATTALLMLSGSSVIAAHGGVHALDEVEYHALFPKVTKSKVAFADAAIRDEFNARLRQLCESGEYQRILKLYHVADLADVCDTPICDRESKSEPAGSPPRQ